MHKSLKTFIIIVKTRFRFPFLGFSFLGRISTSKIEKIEIISETSEIITGKSSIAFIRSKNAANLYSNIAHFLLLCHTFQLRTPIIIQQLSYLTAP